jgi:hypothetical protein
MVQQPMTMSPPVARPPLLREWCIKTSIVLAFLAWLEFIAFGIIAWLTAGHDLFFLLMIPAWPFGYGFVWMVAGGMAQIHSSGPPSQQLPSLFRRLMPRFYFDFVDYTYGFMANLPLLLFPGMMTIFGTLMLWLAMAGKLNVHK